MVRATIALAVGCLASGVAAVGDGRRGRPVKEFMPFYHSSDELKKELDDATSSCSVNGADPNTFTKSQGAPAVDIDVIRIKKSNAASGTKAVLVFGEHARELVSPESALDLVRSLCGGGGAGTSLARQALDQGVEFVIVPNANPLGRKKVEEGYYCKRTNENGVDLNRNWGNEHRNPKGQNPGDEMNPGPMGFSEPETQMLRDLVDTERPDIFLSVHSGAYLLGAPFGYKYGTPQNLAAINEVLKPISEKHCGGDCPYGSLADMIGYKSEGCDIDYVSEHSGVPFAFTWEIYVGEEIRQNYISKARAQATGKDESDEADEFFDANARLNFAQRQAQRKRLRGGTSLAMRRASASLEARLGHNEDGEEPNGCIDQFLPKTSGELNEVIENWTGAYLDLALAVAGRKKGGVAATDPKGPAATKSAVSTTDADPYNLESPAPVSAADVPSVPSTETTVDSPVPAMESVPVTAGNTPTVTTTVAAMSGDMALNIYYATPMDATPLSEATTMSPRIENAGTEVWDSPSEAAAPVIGTPAFEATSATTDSAAPVQAMESLFSHRH